MTYLILISTVVQNFLAAFTPTSIIIISIFKNVSLIGWLIDKQFFFSLVRS